MTDVPRWWRRPLHFSPFQSDALAYNSGMDAYLTTADAALLLRVKRRQVQKLIKAGVIRAVRMGHAHLVRREDALAARGRAGPGRPPGRKTIPDSVK